MTLEEGVLRLLEQCDREDRNHADYRFMYTSEIRHLLGVGPGPGFGELEKLINEQACQSGKGGVV